MSLNARVGKSYPRKCPACNGKGWFTYSTSSRPDVVGCNLITCSACNGTGEYRDPFAGIAPEVLKRLRVDHNLAVNGRYPDRGEP